MIGAKAENAACSYLKKKGFVIIAQNWKNRFCEIDIVAKLDNTVYFVEVKYRKNDIHGSGFDYITPKKLNQMGFAAEYWVNGNNWNGDYCLVAVEVKGPEYKVLDFIEI